LRRYSGAIRVWRASLDVSSATGQLRLLEYIPDRSKQQGRRFPLASISLALSIRFKRVSSRLADWIHWIQSLRATGVMSDHSARAFGWAAARAFRRSTGTLGSGSSATGAISSETTSPASAHAASRNFRSTLSQWPPWPSGSSVARKAKPLNAPSTDVMPREGSFALASLGRVRKVQATAFAVATGRKSVALKRILEAVVESPRARAVRGLLARDAPLAPGFAMLSAIIRSFSCAVSLGPSRGIWSILFGRDGAQYTRGAGGMVGFQGRRVHVGPAGLPR